MVWCLSFHLSRIPSLTLVEIMVRSKLKVQNSSTYQGLSRTQIAFSSTKIIDKKPYPRRGHSKFRLQCDTEVYCTVLTNTVMIKVTDCRHQFVFNPYW